MSYKTYDSYKHLNNNWMNCIPSHWEVNRFKIVFSYSKGKNPQTFFDENDEGLSPYLSMEYLRNNIAPTYVPIKECPLKAESGDILLLWDGSNAGEFVVSKEGLVSSTMAKLTPNITIDKNLSKFLCKSIEPLLRELTIGMGVPHVSTVELNNILIPNIPFEEQKHIANYLNQKTVKINATIAKSKELIDLLEEKRVTLINEVVTKGLNPNVPMKDSGVEWIGDIPEHWNVHKIKDYLKFNIGGTPPTKISEFFEGDNIWVSIADINNTKGETIYDSSIKISDEAIRNSNVKLIPKGSLLYSFKLSVGLTAFAGCDLYTNEAIASFEKNEHVDLDFLKYVFKAGFENNANVNIYGAKLFNSDLIKFAQYVMPHDITEQKQIANYLDNETSKINETIYKIQENIALLEEYKTSLIHHVVTGKIDVRGEEI